MSAVTGARAGRTRAGRRGGRGAPAPTASPVALAVTEVALVAGSLALIFGFSRVFVDRSFAGRVSAFVIVSHLLAIAVRRAGRGLLVSAAVSAVGLGIAVTMISYRGTAGLGVLPTWATRDAVRADLEGAWKVFLDERAPVIVHPGFVLAAAATMWVVAFLADWAAFRLWSPFEALAPGAVVFVFCSLQAAPQDRVSSTVLYAATALVFVLFHRSLRVDRAASWLAADPEHGRRAVVRAGAGVALAAVVAGSLIGPAIPGSDADPAIAWRDIGKGDKPDPTRVTVSPLVTIRDRLVNLASTEAFVVQADRPEYWRITSLDQFDGQAWTSSGSYQSAKGELPTQLPTGTSAATLVQTVTIKALDPPWMPAAYEPLRVDSDGGTRAIYDAESGTLTIGNKVSTAQDLTYVVESSVPQRSAAELRQATDAAVPAEIRARYATPPALSSYVQRRTREAVRGALTPFDKALALQNFFRSGAFTYSLNVAAGHDISSIEAFLRIRTGYCEQYASAYAAMARWVGLPARVAVGFTPGEQDADGLWRVRGEYAHAWPEVYLAGAGWVRFEPTPGRGAPGDESYTGVPFQQPAPGAPGTATTVPVTTTAVPAPGDATEPPAVDPAAAADPDVVEQDIAGGATPLAGAAGSAWRTALRVLAGLVVAAVVAIGAVPFAKRVLRDRRRRRLQGTGRGRIALAWEDATDALGLLQLPVGSAATPNEVARSSARRVPDAVRDPLAELAALTTEARYSPIDPTADAVAAAERAAATIRAVATHHVSRGRRLRRSLDPRPLFPGTTVTAR